MNEEQITTEKLLDTTDCLEAIGVFRFWKNIFFVIIILCLILLQLSFWLVELGYIEAEEVRCKAATAGVKDEPVEAAAAMEKEQISEAAKQVAGEPNRVAVQAAVEQPREQLKEPLAEQESPIFPAVRFRHLAGLIRFLNFVLIPVAVLHCLTMLFSLKVSLLGRLGGINHIARAFFLSLIAIVLLLPWQKLFGRVVVGAMFTPAELLRRCIGCFGARCSVFCKVFYYLRFVGLWLLVVILYVFSQFRSGRWTRTILRRLEVI